MSRYNEILQSFQRLRVGVVGDYLLDEYVLGTTSRVSREAPIVVVDYQGTVHRPGGAANAAQNVTALGGSAVAAGVLGADREGDALSALLEERGVETKGLLRPPGAATSTKLRIMAGEMNAQKQQVARVDRSHRVQLSSDERRRLHVAVNAVASSCRALLVADYGMGVLDGGTIEVALAAGRARGIPVVVDSRHRMREFRGATVATPNEVEAMEALGLADEAALTDADSLRRAVLASGIHSVIVTRGSQGMLVCAGERVECIGIAGNTAATDVTGAGDTVSAVVALSLASGATVLEAARMATFAASVVVMKRGTATASPEEVHAVIDGAGAI